QGGLAAFGGADGIEQVRHGHDALAFARDEQPADGRIGEDRFERALLLARIRPELRLVGEQHREQLDHLRKILCSRRAVLEFHPGLLDVEAKVDHIAVAHHVVLALEAKLARFLRPLLAAVRDEVIVRRHFGADEAALEVGMDDAGGPASRIFCTLFKADTSRCASLSPPLWATFSYLASWRSTVSRSASASSVLIVSMSETGLTLPATWTTFGSSKQRTT